MRWTAPFRCVILSFVAFVFPAAVKSQAFKVQPKRPVSNVTILGSITVTAMPSAVTFQLAAGQTAVGNTPVNITTTWSGITLLSTTTLYAYFTSSSAALTGSHSSTTIPSSAVLGKVSSAGSNCSSGAPSSYTTFTGSSPLGGAGASLQVFSQTTLLGLGGSCTDGLSLEINLTNLPQLSADTYTGTLVIQAQVL